MKIRIGLTFLLIALLVALPAAPAVQAAAPAQVDDPRDVGAFFDSILPAQLKAEHIAGASVSVVHAGKLVFSKGYGFADVAAQKPVNPAQTLFRSGSISKLFVAVAAMQLAERGKLDMNADINQYLKAFQIPATFSKPVTMANLLTHTSGMDVPITGTFVADAAALKPLGVYLGAHLPRRVYPPGEVPAYSNYGLTLAGYIVEQVSGMPFNQYVDVNILKPLGMSHSTFEQPLPASLSANFSTGYTDNGGQLVPQPFEFIQPWPAGSLSATADDMAHFMIAMLDQGSYNGVQILKSQSVQELQKLHFQADANVSGMAYAFEEMRLNGLHLLTKGGDTLLFHSLLALIPSQDTGLFVSYNSSSTTLDSERVLQPFLDRYYPAPTPAAEVPITGTGQDTARFTGDYAITERSEFTYQKIISLANVISIRPAPEGGIFGQDSRFRPQRFIEVSPGVYRQVDGQETLVFHPASNGAMTLLVGNLPIVAFTRLPWYEMPLFQLGLLGLCMLLFLSAILGWPVAALVRRRRQMLLHGRARLARWLAGLGSALALLFILGFTALLVLSGSLAFGINRQGLLLGVLTLGWVSAVLFLGAFILAGLSWVQEFSWGFASHLHYTLVALAGVAFVWFLNLWNLLGYHL
jgi:CubicO group peptidase (beta-lactamase class C family)